MCKPLVHEQALHRAVHVNVQGRCFMRARGHLAGLWKSGVHVAVLQQALPHMVQRSCSCKANSPACSVRLIWHQ